MVRAALAEAYRRTPRDHQSAGGSSDPAGCSARPARPRGSAGLERRRRSDALTAHDAAAARAGRRPGSDHLGAYPRRRGRHRADRHRSSRSAPGVAAPARRSFPTSIPAAMSDSTGRHDFEFPPHVVYNDPRVPADERNLALLASARWRWTCRR